MVRAPARCRCPRPGSSPRHRWSPGASRRAGKRRPERPGCARAARAGPGHRAGRSGRQGRAYTRRRFDGIGVTAADRQKAAVGARGDATGLGGVGQGNSPAARGGTTGPGRTTPSRGGPARRARGGTGPAGRGRLRRRTGGGRPRPGRSGRCRGAARPARAGGRSASARPQQPASHAAARSPPHADCCRRAPPSARRRISRRSLPRSAPPSAARRGSRWRGGAGPSGGSARGTGPPRQDRLIVEEPPQVLSHRLGRRVAVARVLLDRFEDDRLQVAGIRGSIDRSRGGSTALICSESATRSGESKAGRSTSSS